MSPSWITRVTRALFSAPVLTKRAAVLRWLGKVPPIRTEQPAEIKRIFFSFPYHRVGDLILSLTALERVHREWPEAEIDVAVGEAVADVIASVPFVHRVYRIPAPKSARFSLIALEQIKKETVVFVSEIAPNAFDLAIAPRWDSSDSFVSGYLAFLTGAPIRCGYSGTVDGGSGQYDRFYTHVGHGGQHEHESLRYSRILGHCGLTSATQPEPDISLGTIASVIEIAAKRRADGIAFERPMEAPYVVLAPTATRGGRMWPVERFADLGRALHARHGICTVVIGGPGDQAVCEEVCAGVGDHAVNLAGKTSPLQAMDVIADAALFVGNDSGPGHIAGALGIRSIVVSPFPRSSVVDHALSPKRFRPVGPRVRVLQPDEPVRDCTFTCVSEVPHCILQVSSEQVIEQADALLASDLVNATV